MAKNVKKVVVTGLKEIDEALNKLGPTLSRKVARKGLRKAAKLLAKEVKAQAPRDTGDLSKSVKVKSGKRSNMVLTTHVAIIDPELGKIANNVEWGTEHNAANPFMRRAADLKGQETIDLALEELIEQLHEAIKEVELG